jgi:hypothetical protein
MRCLDVLIPQFSNPTKTVAYRAALFFVGIHRFDPLLPFLYPSLPFPYPKHSYPRLLEYYYPTLTPSSPSPRQHPAHLTIRKRSNVRESKQRLETHTQACQSYPTVSSTSCPSQYQRHGGFLCSTEQLLALLGGQRERQIACVQTP